MISLFFRNLFFTIIQPGVVVGLIPYLFLSGAIQATFDQPFSFYQYLGILVFTLGFVLMSICIIYFAVFGKGTISPVDPTKQLVVTGPYQYSRNPMYVGVLLMLIAEAIFFQSAMLWLYALTMFLVFNTFISLFEEPRLRNDFGPLYKAYSEKVRRWV